MMNKSLEQTIEALTLISEAISSDQYIEEVLRLIVIVTAEVMNSKVCSLWLLDEKTQTLTIRATQSMNREYIKKRALNVGEGVVGHVFKENKPYTAYDVLQDSLFKEKELARNMGLASILSVPMSVGDRGIGVVNVMTTTPYHFTDTDTKVLTTVANQAAVAIYNTELMVKTQVIREELEARKTIERAKDVLMAKRKINGEDAFRWIQKRAMSSRKSMREVAEAILLAEEF